jgi:hypothetical protein
LWRALFREKQGLATTDLLIVAIDRLRREREKERLGPSDHQSYFIDYITFLVTSVIFTRLMDHHIRPHGADERLSLAADGVNAACREWQLTDHQPSQGFPALLCPQFVPTLALKGSSSGN